MGRLQNFYLYRRQLYVGSLGVVEYTSGEDTRRGLVEATGGLDRLGAASGSSRQVTVSRDHMIPYSCTCTVKKLYCRHYLSKYLPFQEENALLSGVSSCRMCNPQHSFQYRLLLCTSWRSGMICRLYHGRHVTRSAPCRRAAGGVRKTAKASATGGQRLQGP